MASGAGSRSPRHRGSRPSALGLAATASLAAVLLACSGSSGSSRGSPAAGSGDGGGNGGGGTAGPAYYVDPVAGDDANAGTSESAPWKTLEKVNATTFTPGDRILFRRGGTWSGKLHPLGSGDATRPIVLDAYGTGAKPVIDAQGALGDGTFFLRNQSYWEVSNLDLTSTVDWSTDPGDVTRRGVLVAAANAGLVQHVYLRNLSVHDIKGSIPTTDEDPNAKNSGGILVLTEDDTAADTRFEDVRIEDCEVFHVDLIGIATAHAAGYGSYSPGDATFARRRFTNLVIRGNVVHDIAKNAMVVRLADGALIEQNLAYDTANRAGAGNTIMSRMCIDSTFRLNEGHHNVSSGGYDGSLYDADEGTVRCVFERSYSHDNAQGLFWSYPAPGDQGNVVRYNISQDDRAKIFALHGPASTSGLLIHNNSIFFPASIGAYVIHEQAPTTGTWDYAFENNVLHAAGGTARYQLSATGFTRTFGNNVFYNGAHPAPAGEPADPAKISSDPMLANPGTGQADATAAGPALATLAGYRLATGSPCAGSGVAIPAAGVLDFWGDPVPGSGPNRGADQAP